MKYSKSEIFTYSNFVSLLRILLFFPIFYTIQRLEVDFSYRIYTVILFVFAFITDVLDGFLARKLKQISEVGKIIDPLADKILVALIVIQLYMQDEITPEYFYIILLRDLVIFLGGIYVSKKIGFVLPSNYFGKITVLTITGYLLINVLNGVVEIPILYYTFYYVSIAMSFLSVFVYAQRGIKEVKEHKI